MRKGFFTIVLTLVGLGAAFSQDEGDMQKVLEKALIIQLEIKIVDRDSKTVMTFQAVKVAISGEPFPIQFDGRSIRGRILITPYEEPNSRVLLVAQVQLWLLEAAAGDWKYVTSLKSIPAATNELIRFFPLGVDDAVSSLSDAANIELDIRVSRYKDYMDNMKSPLSGGRNFPWPPMPPPQNQGDSPP